MRTFTHLHVASAYSAHHGTTPPEQLVEVSASYGAEALALTDRDTLSGAVRHIRACLAHGVAPIVGVDLALFSDSAAEPPRVTVLAHGQSAGEGWAALCRLVSAAHHPRKGKSAMKHRVGLPASRLSALLRGASGHPLATLLLGPHSDVGQAVAQGRRQIAEQLLRGYARALPGGVVVEVVCHLTAPGTISSVRHAADLLELAHACSVPAVLTNQVRYLTPDDALTADVLDAAGALLPLGNFPPQPNGQAWLKTPERMEAMAHLIVSRTSLPGHTAERLLADTERVAERCRLHPETDLGWRVPKTPEPEVLGITGDPNDALWDRCERGFDERLGHLRGEARDSSRHRLRTELLTISGFGFATFFLAVADVTDLIRSMGIRNQARGSGSGSLVNYLLRISHVNPLEHHLLFERFLGHRRTTLPDIDVDVESARRHDIYEAIFQRYGSTRVTLLAMQSTYRVRGAARDAGLALGVEEGRIDAFAKQLWRLNARDLRSGLSERPELAELATEIRGDARSELLVDLTERLDRLPRHISMHPCGVLLGNNELLSVTPVQPSGLGLPMSQFDKDDIDDLGLLKLDVLGVRMQSSLAYAVEEIARTHGPRAAIAGALPVDAPYVSPRGRVELDEIPHDDEPTFAHIRSTHTLGMFQIESPGQRELIGKMQPDCYEDLIADISLFRPGPMSGNMLSPYLDGKHQLRAPDYLHHTFRPFLRETFGVVIYHEQVLRILHLCMGVDLAEADEIRRRLSGNTDAIEARFQRLSARRRNARGERIYSDGDIERIWKVLSGFGSFGFCKAHGAAFALPTWQSAWLKTHYPAEFFAGVLTHDPGMYPKRLLVGDARRMGIPILPVDVNRSERSWRVERVRDTPPGEPTRPGDLGLRVALSDIQGMSNAELERILSERPFHSVGDFWERARPSRRLAERLALIGGLDSLEHTGPSRADLLARIRGLTRASRRPRTPQPDELQLSFDFREVHGRVTSARPELSAAERTQAELDVLSLDLSQHLVESYRPLLDELGVVPADSLLALRSNTEVTVAGVRVATQTPPMRSGKRVVFLTVDDGTGCADATFFDDAQVATGSALFGAKLLLIHGKTRRTGARGVSIQAERALDLKAVWQEWSQHSRSHRGSAASPPNATPTATPAARAEPTHLLVPTATVSPQPPPPGQVGRHTGQLSHLRAPRGGTAQTAAAG